MNPCEELGVNISTVVSTGCMLTAGFSDSNSKRGALRAPRRLCNAQASQPASYTLDMASFNRQTAFSMFCPSKT